MKITMRIVHEKTVRSNVTTQLEFSVDEWPDNIFCLWLPECVYADFDDLIWEQWDPLVGHQDFKPKTDGGFEWRFSSNRCEILSRAAPEESCLNLQICITNRSKAVMPNVFPNNCLHFPKAPDFFCLDYSRVWIRNEGAWRTVLSTDPSAPPNFFFRAEMPTPPLPSHVVPEWINVPVDHPVIIVESTNGKKTVGIVAHNWQHVFHNSHLQLGCIHSEPQPARQLKPADTAVFQQRIYLHDGDRASFVREYGKKSYEFGYCR